MSGDELEWRIPLMREEVDVEKAVVVTDRLRVSTIVEEKPATVEGTIERGDVVMERVSVERAVAQVPEPRREGDTLIVSIVEERLVVEKRLFVIEELHITTTTRTEHFSVAETVRTMRAEIDHNSPSSATDPSPATKGSGSES